MLSPSRAIALSVAFILWGLCLLRSPTQNERSNLPHPLPQQVSATRSHGSAFYSFMVFRSLRSSGRGCVRSGPRSRHAGSTRLPARAFRYVRPSIAARPSLIGSLVFECLPIAFDFLCMWLIGARVLYTRSARLLCILLGVPSHSCALYDMPYATLRSGTSYRGPLCKSPNTLRACLG